ncbi:hypothetical protein CAEBREN_03065 [Caenorhabditis brenneri]|uniref:Uncharacterized protein n=1 Tax=Caenorhabditis brenneri TaxID=135651 RepID=G0PEJ9_CAEBE|nr:hypothetical protein CAEBREN_03065 [Caenorhabditis brenneri]
MLFLTLFLMSTVTILLPNCSSLKGAENHHGSKPKAKSPKKDAGKTPIPKEKSSKKEEVVLTSKLAKSDSAKTATPAPPKKPEAVKNPNPPSLILNKSKDPEKAAKKKAPAKQSLIKESKYAGIQEKTEVKPPPTKLPSVMTLPSKEATTAHQGPEEPPKARLKVEINERSDDTIENIPSVKTKEGVSFEGDSNAINSPAGTKEDGKLVPFVPGEMAKEKKK